MAEKRKLTLLRIFKKAAKRGALLLVFSTAIFGSTSGPASSEEVPVGLSDKAAAQPSLHPALDHRDVSMLPYSQQVFFYNAPTPTSGDEARIAAMTGEERMHYYMQQSCFLNGMAGLNNVREQDLAKALDSLSHLTYLGKPLVDLAAENKVEFCALDRLPHGIAAQYIPDIHSVVSGPTDPQSALVLQLAHEITHAAQDKNDLLGYGQTWDIQSRVQRNLSVEAAALTSEFMVAFEAKVAGDPSYWNFIQTHYAGTTYNDKEMYRLIQATYDQTIAAGGTEDAALRAAGRAAWLRVFEGDDWRNFYFNLELDNYMKDIAANKFDGDHTLSHQMFGQDKMDLAGKIGAQESFTAGAHFPDYDALLARNPKMKWAFEAAEIARMRQMANGATAADALRAQALLGGNPYLNLDMTAISRQASDESWAQGKNFRYLYEVMDEALKPIPVAAPAPVAPQVPLNAKWSTLPQPVAG